MSKNKYQEIVFAINDYKWQNTEDEARSAMWKDITQFLQILFKNTYKAVIYDDDTDIIVIQYEHDDNKEFWDCYNPEWITDDEYNLITMNRHQTHNLYKED